MKRKNRKFLLFPLLLLTAMLMTLASMAALSNQTHAASIGQFPVGTMQPIGAIPPAAQSNMTYHGGPVMRGTAHIFLIFWEPTRSFVSPEYNSLLKRYFEDVNDTGLYENNQQYIDFTGQAPEDVVLADSFTDKRPYPLNPLTDKQVQDEITSVMKLKGWKASIDNAFFVYTAAGKHNAQADKDGACAYHSFFGTNTIYAAIVYPTVRAGCETATTPNRDLDADSAINSSSHEQMEAATDPLVNAWFDKNSRGEIGNKCESAFGPIDSRGANVTFHGHPYIVQKEWDNLKMACVLKGP